MQYTIKILILSAILIVSLVTSLQFGSTFIPLTDVLNSLSSHLGGQNLSIPQDCVGHMRDRKVLSS